MSAADTIAMLGKRLVAAVGAVAAAGLLTTTPMFESGRTVEATVQPTGEVAVRHIAGRENLKAYRDVVGVWTICDGSTKGVYAYQTVTREQCLVRLIQDLVDHAEPMMKCVPTLREPGRDNQRWAIVSLAVNFGTTKICASTPAQRFRERRWREGCEAFLLWNKAGRPLKVVTGLVNRRQKERAICLRGLA